MWPMILQLIQGQPKFKSAVENIFGQPVEHVVNCIGGFMDNVQKGPGLVNTAAKQLELFNKLYKGGLAIGFSDWESELFAARLAGYSDIEICTSFRERHNWPRTTVENIAALAKELMPRLTEQAKKAGLLPPEMFPQSGLPQTQVESTGGVAPWETLLHSGADGSKVETNAPTN